MANGNPKKAGPAGGRDMVMESRHLLGVFLGVVVLCGVFFTLGYVMGRTQYDSSVRAAIATKPATPSPAPVNPMPPSGSQATAPIPSAPDWTFPGVAESKKTPEAIRPLEPKPKQASAPPSAVRSAPASSAVAKPAISRSSSKLLWNQPRIPRGAILLQVAALTREGDALALAEALQRKEYPAFVATPGSDNLYRVQVGPYADVQSADIARRSLEREGFKAITKR